MNGNSTVELYLWSKLIRTNASQSRDLLALNNLMFKGFAFILYKVDSYEGSVCAMHLIKRPVGKALKKNVWLLHFK